MNVPRKFQRLRFCNTSNKNAVDDERWSVERIKREEGDVGKAGSLTKFRDRCWGMLLITPASDLEGNEGKKGKASKGRKGEVLGLEVKKEMAKGAAQAFSTKALE